MILQNLESFNYLFWPQIQRQQSKLTDAERKEARSRDTAKEDDSIRNGYIRWHWICVEKFPAHYTYDAPTSLPLITITFGACAFAKSLLWCK